MAGQYCDGVSPPLQTERTFNHGHTRVSKTAADKLEVIDWIEKYGNGVPTRALTYFRDERGWIVSGSQNRQWWKKKKPLRETGTTRRRVAGGCGNLGGPEEALLIRFYIYLLGRGYSSLLELSQRRDWVIMSSPPPTDGQIDLWLGMDSLSVTLLTLPYLTMTSLPTVLSAT
ncbi:hypothetical protein PHMEG_00032020 [Phytophthora megakarya]|uniref:Uncharacterized protein n=1 Tax=Phytophthora megakarya TaxID=4795 RepID=A0A225UWK5_9STRA|nr:hypothetical protein PHMEG_00032020 [Phytophthora megakarya]